MNNLFSILSRTINKSTALIPTDDSKEYLALSTLDETRYYLSTHLCFNPITQKLFHIFTDGVHHITDATKKIVYRLSTDFGLTYGSKTTLYDPTDGTMQVQDPGAGYDSNGRLHLMVDVHSTISATGGDHELRYMYSDDDLATISSPVVIPFPVATSLPTMRIYGKIRQNGTLLMCPAYFFTEEGDFTETELYVLRSTDGGANWDWESVGNDTSKQISESNLLHIQGDIWIMVSREEITKQFWMFKTFDNGLTWLDCGLFSTEHVMGLAHPPILHKFKADDGMDVGVMYVGDRTNERLYAYYSKLENFVIGGVGGWNLTTRTLLRQDTEWLHYGDFFHYNNNMNARGAWVREASSVVFEDNEMLYFENMATHYSTVYDIIAPTTIYDYLASLKAAYSWRGLVANTTNDSGTVNGSNQITLLKSLRAGPTGVNLSATAGGIILGDGMELDGTKALVGSDLTYFQPLHYSSVGDSDINYTIYFTAKFGTGSNPNAAYGLYGNNGATSNAKGAAMFFDDRAAQPRNNALVLQISKNTVGVFLIRVTLDNMITPNTKFVGCIRIDLSQSVTNNKVKFSINGVDQTITVAEFNTGGVATPSQQFQLGATGNNGLLMVGNIYDWIWQNAIDIDDVRNNMIDTLMDLEGL